ncbi:MAG: aminotransferase class III-fold pyridoxal phosphate-dependent enzyme [Bacteroidota bacterium]
MKLFDVYPLFDIQPAKAEGCWLWDEQGTKYLDLYGGHAVISIGHGHPTYVQAVQQQVSQLGFYSNSVQNPLQHQLAEKLTRLSGYDDYRLFLINSGAEAMENALKLASFHTGREKILTLDKAFHGRTSAAVAITDNPKVQAPINFTHHVEKIAFNDAEALKTALETNTFCAVVIEGLQGVGGVQVPDKSFLQLARQLCDETGTVLIMDEIQSGYGRSGKFFAHQHADVKADLITLAKGMGNGFPIGGVLISPDFEAWYGMLGTTFGGNHLACAAGIAVLDVLETENLIQHAADMGEKLMTALEKLSEIEEVRGYGLMIGLKLKSAAKPIRSSLLYDHHIFTGSSSDPKVLRILPPLNIGWAELQQFVSKLTQVLQTKPIPNA